MAMQKGRHHGNQSRPKKLMEAFSTRVTRQIGAHFGEVWPMHFVSEFPRSGGTWIARMLADYLLTSAPGASVFPLGMRCVVHNHWRFHPKLQRVVYVSRDGRDVMVSYYFHLMRAMEYKPNAKLRAIKRQYDKLLGAGFDWNDSKKYLAPFLEHELRHPSLNSITWAQHVRNWLSTKDPEKVLVVTYEDMLADTVATLTRAAEHQSREPADERRIRLVVDHHSMESLTGRKSGDEDRGDFIRKGIAGDWINHFTPEAARVFHDLAGDALQLTGYEPDAGWIDRCSTTSEAVHS